VGKKERKNRSPPSPSLFGRPKNGNYQLPKGGKKKTSGRPGASFCSGINSAEGKSWEGIRNLMGRKGTQSAKKLLGTSVGTNRTWFKGGREEERRKVSVQTPGAWDPAQVKSEGTEASTTDSQRLGKEIKEKIFPIAGQKGGATQTLTDGT